MINVEILIQSSFPNIVVQIRDQLVSPFAMETTILMCWTLWMMRNDLIFKGIQPSLAEVARGFFSKRPPFLNTGSSLVST
jgi:hypothetical protein